MPIKGMRLPLLAGFLAMLAIPGLIAESPPKPAGAALIEAENEVSARVKGAAWQPGIPVLPLRIGDALRTGQLSRATARLTDLSVLRINEVTTIEILPRQKLSGSEGINVRAGALYFFSRDRPRELRIQTPVATGALRGTEFHVAVASDGRTTVTMLDGEVELSNAHGSVLIRSGEQGEVVRGQAPKKTAVIETINIIQWCLYYPGVLDLDELTFPGKARQILEPSLEAYRQGDVLGALRSCPMDRLPTSESEQIYRAAVLLAVGQVDKANAELKNIRTNSPQRRALETVIAAVKYQPDGSELAGASTDQSGDQPYDFKSAKSSEPKERSAGRGTQHARRVRSPDEEGSAGRRTQQTGGLRSPDGGNSDEPQSASEWLARSYYEQSRAKLEKALAAAKRATEISPSFGFAWTRVAELEFSFGRTENAARALEKGASLAPLNAASFALRGFVLSAQNSIGQAIESFERAMKLDGALGDAWLGRGLCYIRRRHDVEGRKDIQTAAVLEPNRSLFRSYLGKAFSEVGAAPRANLELKRAIELDPNDPTPWLYSAIEKKQENRYNEAIEDLGKSIELNDNRRIYRSRFLLDQDRSIRGTNLAAIYQDDGMTEQSVREAIRAVDNDYTSAPAHLFLSDSYNALRDPDRILLRYETPWLNERLLSNLLSPVGGGPLSQFVSEQEYSKMFEQDGFGFNSVTDYFSYGEWRNTTSQYGTFGNISYSIDSEYQYNDGLRPNSQITRVEEYGTVKLQVTPQDTFFFQVKWEDLENGNVFQLYDQRQIDPFFVKEPDGMGGFTKRKVQDISDLTFAFEENEDPGWVLAGWHHEWSPENHTLLLVGHLGFEQTLTAQRTRQTVILRDVTQLAKQLPPVGDEVFSDPFAYPEVIAALRTLTGRGRIISVAGSSFDFNYMPDFEAFTVELQHISTTGPNTIILGGRYQTGDFQTRTRLTSDESFDPPIFDRPAASQDFDVNLERINLYFYDILQVAPWLSITAGVTYDWLSYPDNFRSPPINDRQRDLDKASPKVGFILQPARGTVLRGSYAQAISGASFDESVRLEPTQIAGFTQAYRTLISESLIGSVAGSKYDFWGVSLEQKLPTHTFFGVEYDLLQQELEQTVGVFDLLITPGIYPVVALPSSLDLKHDYREDVLTATINQLIGNDWSLGASFRYTRSRLHEEYPGLEAAVMANSNAGADLVANADSQRESRLQELDIFALYNHPSGFFARADALWFKQANGGYPRDDKLTVWDEHRPGDDFWQLNLIAGCRFYRNQCEISCGVLNLTGQDYRLNPLNPYLELPRSQTFIVRAKLSF